MKKVAALVLVLSLTWVAPAFANKILEDAQSDDYVVKAPAMLLRGAGNVVLAGVEILEHGYKGTTEGPFLVGTIKGTAHGIYWAMDRAGRGAWDILTFWAPRYNGAPPSHQLDFLSSETAEPSPSPPQTS